MDSEPESIKDYGGFRSGAEILGEFYFSLDLEAGEHRIDLPVAFSGLDRLLMVGSYAMIQEGACAAAFEIRPGTAPGSRRIAVYPQKWFTRDKIDLGYQWITRMAREPDSGRLVGDGIRLPRAFVMEKDGCHVERWIGPEQ
ncbi:MAG TPA: hypothetical protein VJZ71_17085 [Phycisphaerae bacterium]|nr:hypothetical protein [Phycisphaerae bacterium]